MKLTILCLSIISNLVLAADAPPLPDGATVGRFVIVTGQMESGPEGTHKPVILRIDTATGQTWRLEPHPFFDKSGKLQAYADIWTEINEAGGKTDLAFDESIRAAAAKGK